MILPLGALLASLVSGVDLQCSNYNNRYPMTQLVHAYFDMNMWPVLGSENEAEGWYTFLVRVADGQSAIEGGAPINVSDLPSLYPCLGCYEAYIKYEFDVRNNASHPCAIDLNLAGCTELLHVAYDFCGFDDSAAMTNWAADPQTNATARCSYDANRLWNKYLYDAHVFASGDPDDAWYDFRLQVSGGTNIYMESLLYRYPCLNCFEESVRQINAQSQNASNVCAGSGADSAACTNRWISINATAAACLMNNGIIPETTTPAPTTETTTTEADTTTTVPESTTVSESTATSTTSTIPTTTTNTEATKTADKPFIWSVYPIVIFMSVWISL